jgi:argininosuccinate lyase
MKLWSKGYELDDEIERYTVGDDLETDRVLLPHDCRASVAHARVLHAAGVLTAEETERLVVTLEALRTDAEAGRFEILPGEEDGHTALENRLVERLGDLGKKIHTARSRNDQVVVAMRLFMKTRLTDVVGAIDRLVDVLTLRIGEEGSVGLPGYSHMRKAMPSSVGLWLGAYVEAMADDKRLLGAVHDLIDQNPLGSGAGFGIPVLEIDRQLSAELLGFARVQSNPLDVQNSRGKFEASVLAALVNVMGDLNRMASDLILFSMDEFGFVRLPRELCTGSSIMPQKLNPDALELMRARYHDVLARELQVRTTTAGLVSGYHRDYQRTKRPLVEGFELTESSLDVMIRIVQGLVVDREACTRGCTDDLRATERVYELVRGGMPFRDAYRRVAAELFPDE